MRKNKLLKVVLPVLLFAITLIIACQKKNVETPPDQTIQDPKLKVASSEITGLTATTNAPADAGNFPASYALDGNYSTHWSGKVGTGDSTNITFDLGSAHLYSVTSVQIAFYTAGSTTRTSNFDVAVSPDGHTGWVTTIYHQNSAPNITTLQSFTFPAVRGRYVRITGHGNNSAAPANIWNSYSEVKVFGDVVSAPTSTQINLQGGLIYGTPVNPYNAPYTPANVVDGDLNTHWTGQMANSTDYKYLIIDLDNTYLLDKVRMSFYNNGDGTRQTRFSVETSNTDTLAAHFSRVISNTYSALDYSGLETFDFSDVTAKYVKITCYGNTSSGSALYNSINEIQIWGTPPGLVDVIADYETNNFTQWHDVEYVNASQITISSAPNPVWQGDHAAKFIVSPTDIYGDFHGTQRAEVAQWDSSGVLTYTQEKAGDDFYYGWSTLFPTGWTSPTGFGVTNQWQVFSVSGNPAITFNASADSLSVNFSSGTFWNTWTYTWDATHTHITDSTASHHYSFNYWIPYDPAHGFYGGNNYKAAKKILSTLSAGSWHDFIVHIKFEPDSTGKMEVWHRLQGSTKFTQVLNYQTVPTLPWNSKANTFGAAGGSTAYTKSGTAGYTSKTYCKTGLYRGAGNTVTNTLYHDNWARGTSYEAIRARFK